ncbi:hypothetical protein PV350_41230 [Streptomyces sp. PA03-6a]|nr:hypothetical protein [Streptomyces sp. PA03-6a]
MHAIWALAAEAANAGFDWTPVWTLVGVAVTAASLLIGQWLTQRAAGKQAEAQAVRELSKWHRELRRQSYADCVIAYERFRDLLQPIARAIPWPVGRALTPEEAAHLGTLLVTLGERYDDAFQKCQVARLEGPEAVAKTAHRLIVAGTEFRAAAEARAEAARVGMQPPDPSAWDLAAESMDEELDDFIVLARSVIAVD